MAAFFFTLVTCFLLVPCLQTKAANLLEARAANQILEGLHRNSTDQKPSARIANVQEGVGCCRQGFEHDDGVDDDDDSGDGKNNGDDDVQC